MRVYLTLVGGYHVDTLVPCLSLIISTKSGHWQPADACSWIVDIKVLLLALGLHFYQGEYREAHLFSGP